MSEAISGIHPFERSRRDNGRYEAALETIGEAIACYTRLRNRAVTSGNAAEADRLWAEQSACVADQHRLHPDDTAAVERVLVEYPPLIEWLRDRIG
jgi:hypothetical protein